MYETTWRDVAAWSGVMKTELTPWEVEAVISMSAAYTSGVMAYNDNNSPSPWVDTETLNRDAIAREARRAFGG